MRQIYTSLLLPQKQQKQQGQHPTAFVAQPLGIDHPIFYHQFNTTPARMLAGKLL
jgi:hypothetical protein